MAAVSRREVLKYGAGLGVGVVAGPSGVHAAAAAPTGNGTAGSAGTGLSSGVLGNVFVGSEVPAFRVRSDRSGLRWTARDLVGAVVASGAVSGGRFEARVPDRGWYSLEVADRAGTVLARDTFALLAPYRPERDSPFGVNTHLPPAALVPLLARLGAGWARVDLTWADVEPAPLAGWTPWVYQADATVELDTAVARTGTGSAKIVNRTAKADNVFASLAQQVTVEPHTTHTFSAWVKGVGVNALQFTVRPDWGDRVDAPAGTFDWTRVSFDHTTGTETDLTFRVLSNDVTTAAWLDDASVTAAGSTTNLLANPGFEAGTGRGFTFAGYDPYLTALHRYGIRPLAILDYANPQYDGGLTPYDAAGRAAFARYATEVLRHYRGVVTAVEVYNEYNAGWFTTGPCSADPSCYQELLRATYQAVKAVDPAVTVVGGVTFGTALDWLASVFDGGGAAYLDAVSNHPYTAGAPDAATPLDEAERQVSALVGHYTGGTAKPVWISELGWSLSDEPTTAAYLVRGAVLALAAGVAKYFWYDLVGDQNFGLLDQPTAGTYAPRPAFVAYAVLVRQLAGRDLTAGGEVAGARSYAFGRLAVLWTGEERAPVAVAADGPVTVTDVVGTRTVLHPSGGAVRLTLTGSPLYVEPARTGPDGQALVTAGSDVDATAPRLTLTSAGALTVTYLLDNSTGRGAAEASFVTFHRTTTVRAGAGARVTKAVTFPLTDLAEGRNTIVSTVRRDGAAIGRLVSSTVLIDVPDHPVATVGAVDWSDAELALAPAGYASLPASFPRGVDFTVGVDDPATGWPYIHPGPDDGWAGGTAHAFTLRFTLPAAPAADLRLVVFLLDTHNTAPGTVDVALNGGPATTVTLPAGSGSGATEGSAFTSGDRPASFTVPLPAPRLVAGANAVTLTKSSGSWMVYDALGVYA